MISVLIAGKPAAKLLNCMWSTAQTVPILLQTFQQLILLNLLSQTEFLLVFLV